MLWSTCLWSSNGEASICCTGSTGHCFGFCPWGQNTQVCFPGCSGVHWKVLLKQLQDKLSPQIPSGLWAPCLVLFRKRFPGGFRGTTDLAIFTPGCQRGAGFSGRKQTWPQEAEPTLQTLLWLSIAACLQSWHWPLHLQSSSPFQNKMGKVWSPKDQCLGPCSISLCLILAGVLPHARGVCTRWMVRAELVVPAMCQHRGMTGGLPFLRALARSWCWWWEELLLSTASGERKCSLYYFLGHLPRKRFLVIIAALLP